MKRTNKKGFTLVELVIVIAIIAILAAVLIPTFSGVVEKANQSKAMQSARNTYTEYLASIDYTADTVADTKDFYIISGNYAFYVDNTGAFQSAIVTEPKTNVKILKADGTAVESGKSFTVTNGKAALSQ